jgi:hypothetical protein
VDVVGGDDPVESATVRDQDGQSAARAEAVQDIGEKFVRCRERAL